MFMNILTTSYFALIVRRKIRSFEFSDMDTVFYNNLLALPVLLSMALTEYNEIFELVNRYADSSYMELLSLWYMSGTC